MDKPQRRLFLSHASEDSDIAQSLKQRLLDTPGAQEVGLDIWVDFDNMPGGRIYKRSIKDALAAADSFAIILTQQGIKEGMQDELDVALDLNSNNPDFLIVPIISADIDIKQFPPPLPSYHGVKDPLNNPDQLVRLLNLALGREDAAPLAMTAQPFPGLRAMTEAWADRFFGRTAEVDEVLARLRHHPVVWIEANSSAGKSSLAMAGVAPAWNRGALVPDRPRVEEDAATAWRVVTMRPGDHPLNGLRDGVEAAARALGRSVDEIKGYRAEVESNPQLALLCGLNPQIARTLLIVDQAEELQTLTAPADRAAFAELLGRLLGECGDRLKLLFTCRIDLSHVFYDWSGAGRRFWSEEASFILKPPQDFSDIVRGPLCLAGYNHPNEQEQLVANLTASLEQRPSALALAQMALHLAWRDRRFYHGSVLAAYNAHGGAVQALGREAERVANDPKITPSRDALMAIFIRLVRMGEIGVAATHRIAARDEFSADQQALIDRLAGDDCGRLIQTGKDSDSGVLKVEIAHEALITQWAYLLQYITGSAAAIRRLGDVIEQAGKWRRDRRADRLASPADAPEFLRLQREHPEWLSADEHSFITASSKHWRWIDWRNRVVALVVLLLALAALGFLWRATQSEKAAVTAEKRAEQLKGEATTAQKAADTSKRTALALLARSKAADDPVAAIKLVLASWPEQAADVIPTPDVAFQALRMAIQAPRQLTQLRHEGGVWRAAFSPDGSRIVTVASDKTARLWDAATGNELRRFTGHERAVVSAAFSPDGARIVTASLDMTVRLWDAATGKELLRFNGHTGAVFSASFSADGAFIVTASDDKTARLLDAATGQELRRFIGHGGMVYSATFSPDGARIVTSSWDKTARLWDAANGKELRSFIGHKAEVNSAAFSPDGARIVTASDDMTARLWDAATGKELRRFSGHDGWIGRSAFSPDGARIVTASADKTVRLWDAATGQELRRFNGHEKDVISAAFSPDGARIVTASMDNTARLWDGATGQELRRFSGDRNAVIRADVSPDGAKIVTTASDQTARLWDVTTGLELHRFNGHYYDVSNTAFSPDGGQIVTASGDKTARLWGAATGQELRRFSGHEGVVTSAAFSPDSSHLVTASWDKTARLWDVRTGQELRRFIGHENWVTSAAFSPDGARIVTASWDKTARLWDAATGQELRRFSGHKDRVMHAAFSPDGARIVTASQDNTARLWDAATGQELRRFIGHSRGVESVVFSPDGARIATASWDKTVRLWDVASGAELYRFELGAEAYSVAFGSQGRSLVVGLEDGTARLYSLDLPAGNILQVACQWLPMVNGQRDRDVAGLAREIGIDALPPIPACEGYNPPLPPEGWTLKQPAVAR